jgi:hypothetical protein
MNAGPRRDPVQELSFYENFRKMFYFPYCS